MELPPLPLANCAIYFDHNPQKSQSQSEFTPVRTLQETVIHGIMGGYYLTCSCFSMFSRHSYSGRNLFPYICPPIYDCFVVICHMHMTASPRIFCVVLWSAAMLTKSPQVPLKGRIGMVASVVFLLVKLWESESSKSWAFYWRNTRRL